MITETAIKRNFSEAGTSRKSISIESAFQRIFQIVFQRIFGILLVLAALLSLLAVPALALTEEENLWLEDRDVLRVGYLESYLPFSGTGESSQATGLVKDIVPLMIDSIGAASVPRIEYTGFTRSEDMYKALDAGEIDTAFPVYGDDAFAGSKNAAFSECVIGISIDLVYTGTYSEKTTEVIAVNSNNDMQEFYSRSVYPDAEIVYFDTIDECIDAVAKGTAGTTILNGLRTSALLRKANDSSLKELRIPTTVEFCFAVRADNSDLLSLINTALNEISSGAAITYSYNYVDSIATYTALDFVKDNLWLFIMAVVLFAVVTGLLVVSRNSNRKMAAAKKQIEAQNAEIEEAREIAESANRSKTQFLFSMSHDIRTPMNAILGYTDIGFRHADDSAVAKDSFAKIKTSGTHMLSLINDILEMSRIEAGRLELDESPVDVREALKGVEQMSRALAVPKSIDLTVEVDELENPYVYADLLHTNEVLINLISNAVKYTEQGGKVTFSVSQTGKTEDGRALYRFVIADSGIGMSEEFQRHLFETFSREKTSTVSKIEGTGLGLSIVKNIVDQTGGTISVKRKSGEGSTFTVDLPFRIMVEEAIEKFLGESVKPP